MLRLRLFGHFLAINLNLNLLYAANFIPFYSVNIDSFPSVLLDSFHLYRNELLDFSLSPISNVPLFNPIDGFLLQTGFTTRFNYDKPVEFSFKPRYAIQSKALYAVAELSAFIYKDNFKSTQLLFSGGNFLIQVNIG